MPSLAVPSPTTGHARGHGLVALSELHQHPQSHRQVDPALLPGFISTLYPPTATTTQTSVITAPNNAAGQAGQTATYTSPAGTYGVPQPSAAEIRREEFVARFTGRYQVGSPRFSDQSATIHIYSDGNSAGSNQFLHGRAQVVLFPPADPGAQPTTNDPVAGQTEGILTFFPTNFLETSDTLFFDLSTPSGTSANDPSILDHGLPSHLVATLDTVGTGFYTNPAYSTTPAVSQTNENGSPVAFGSGVSGAVDYSAGTGVVDIKYVSDHHPGGTFTGRCVVTFQGLVNLSGIFNAVNKQIN